VPIRVDTINLMHDSSVIWRPDGFRLDLVPGTGASVPVGALALMYVACAPALIGALLEPALVPLLGSYLVPLPAALLWAAFGPNRVTVVEVDHQRLVVRGPLRVQQSVPLRAIREIEVRLDGLALSLDDGAELRVIAPATLPRLVWLAARLRELCDEVHAFEVDLDDRSRTDGARVRELTRAIRAEV
jgi:hypothetical protein